MTATAEFTITQEAPPTGRTEFVPTEKQRLALAYDVDELLYGGAAGGGKDLHVDTPVLTPDGWRRHGDLQPGDRVYGHNGAPVRVLASYRPPRSQLWRVTFSNGEQIVAGNGHLWTVQTEADRSSLARSSPEFKARRRAARPSRAKLNPVNAGSQRAITAANRLRAAEARVGETAGSPWDYTRTVETWELAALVNSERQRVSVPAPAPLLSESRWEAGLDPWVFGLWLGDGSRTSGALTVGHDDREETEARLARAGFTRYREMGDGITATYLDRSGVSIHRHLTAMYGRGGKHEKRIPEWVLTASYADRLAVIQGLLDADGSVNERGQIELCLSDYALFSDALALLATLGIRPASRAGRATYTRDGQRIVCGTRYRAKFMAHEKLFRLSRKAQAQARPTRAPQLRVMAVEPVEGTAETNCISVDDPYSIYLAGRTLIPTHNTEVLIAAGLRLCKAVPGATALLLRRTHKELHDIRKRIRAAEPAADFNKTEGVFYFPNGAQLHLGYAQRDDDVLKWQGSEFQLLLIDELTHFTRYQYTFLQSRLRASGHVLEGMNRLGVRPRTICSANPGGTGHAWVRARFVDPAPAFQQFRTRKGVTRVYVPARLTDNPHLDQDEYMRRLSGLDPVMRRAMIDGDWDILLGSVRFPQWRRHLHVVDPEDYPLDLVEHPRAVGVDYGVADPFAAVWGALMPDGTVVVYRETTGTDMTAGEQAQRILDLEQEGERTQRRPVMVAADRSMWNRTGRSGAKQTDVTRPDKGSIAFDYWQAFGSQLRRSDSDRRAGWALIDKLLRPRECDGSCGVDECPGHPRLVVYSSCVNVIRDLASLPRSKRDPEDAETSNVDDHVPDALRYMLMELVNSPHARSEGPPVQGQRRVRGARPVSAGLRNRRF